MQSAREGCRQDCCSWQREAPGRLSERVANRGEHHRRYKRLGSDRRLKRLTGQKGQSIRDEETPHDRLRHFHVFWRPTASGGEGCKYEDHHQRGRLSEASRDYGPREACEIQRVGRAGSLFHSAGVRCECAEFHHRLVERTRLGATRQSSRISGVVLL